MPVCLMKYNSTSIYKTVAGYAMVCADGTRSEECNILSCQNDGKGNGVYDPGEVPSIAMCLV